MITNKMLFKHLWRFYKPSINIWGAPPVFEGGAALSLSYVLVKAKRGANKRVNMPAWWPGRKQGAER
ncbi:MAG: hypothetical protein EAY75_14565 [Bacteroidetes bacterium]|nr:MAG: hypothetical protein EAY75_14565 [Bacteroidota bacterium]